MRGLITSIEGLKLNIRSYRKVDILLYALFNGRVFIRDFRKFGIKEVTLAILLRKYKNQMCLDCGDVRPKMYTITARGIQYLIYMLQKEVEIRMRIGGDVREISRLIDKIYEIV
jgi:hypothetical protein